MWSTSQARFGVPTAILKNIPVLSVMKAYKLVYTFQPFILIGPPWRCRQDSVSAPRPRYQNKSFYHRKLGFSTAVFPFNLCWTSKNGTFFELQKLNILIRSNKMQQYAGIYLLQNHSTCFGCPSHPSSGVHKILTTASGTGQSIWAASFLQHGL